MSEGLLNLKSGQITVANASGTTATAAEINTLSGVIGGAVQASKALVADANIDIGTGLRNLTATGAVTGATVAGTTSGTFGKVVALPTTQVCSAGSPAITIVAGEKMVFVTKGSVCAMTLALPTATTHDGVMLKVITTTAFAHTITTPAGGINGASTIATFAAAVGNYIRFVAYQGVWYVCGSTGVTLS